MTDSRTSGADLWTAASADVEQETHDRLFTAARIEAAEYWPVLANASSRDDFRNRLSVVASQLDAAVASVLDEDTEGYFATIRSDLTAAFAQDFDILQGRKAAQRRRHEATLQREVIADIRREAEETWSGPDTQEFSEAPADGQTGPTDTGGTPGSDAPYAGNTLIPHPGLDDSAGPNVLESDDLTTLGVFVTAEFHAAAVEFQRRHFNHIADAIKSAPVDEETRERLARHFADHLSGTNPNFNRDRFVGASTHTASRLDFSKLAEDQSYCRGCGLYEAPKHGSYCYQCKEDREYGRPLQWRNKNKPRPKRAHNEGLMDPAVESRTECAMCHHKGFDGQRCHACGWNGKVAGLVDKVKNKLHNVAQDAEADALGAVLDHSKISCHVVKNGDSYDVIAGGKNRGSHKSREDAEAQREAIESSEHSASLHTARSWEMYSDGGDEAVEAAFQAVGGAATDEADAQKKVQTIQAGVAPTHPEVNDTAVREILYARLLPGTYGSQYFAYKMAEVIAGENWDTGEVALQFANDYGLYQASQGISSADEAKDLWHEHNPNDSVDTNAVNWDAVYNDIKAGQDETADYEYANQFGASKVSYKPGNYDTQRKGESDADYLDRVRPMNPDSDVAPDWFDPADAGESWDEDE